ncbi:MAG: HD domain-containing phosphohydrolase [Candidatus Nitrospinota bacterium M3_3B_026]
MSTILIVDDNEDSIVLYESIISSRGYRVITAGDGEEALEKLKAAEGGVDLVLSDIMMPKIDGLGLARRIKSDPDARHIPVILLTAGKREREDMAGGLDVGADDYLVKPVDTVELMARLRSHLRVKKLQDELTLANRRLAEMNDNLEQLVEERTVEIMLTRNAAIFGLAKIAERRDPETGGHLERIREYTRALAIQMRKAPRFRDVIDDDFIVNIYQSSPLHDVGKVGIPDSILLKPGKLTPEEFEIMKTHSTIGGDSLAAAERSFAGDSFLSMGRDIAYYHHERWNGKGYPKGLEGDEIPLAARIMALADVYDALVSKRVYKEAMSHEEARKIILGEEGEHFDPDIVAAFREIDQLFLETRRKHSDE